jgi:hypothetical protein
MNAIHIADIAVYDLFGLSPMTVEIDLPSMIDYATNTDFKLTLAVGNDHRRLNLNEAKPRRNDDWHGLSETASSY